MLNPNSQEKTAPPRLIPSLVEGFNSVASNSYILLFPIFIDVFLWFGPMVRIKNLLFPVLMRAVELSASAYGEEGELFKESSQRLWTVFLEGFNLIFGIRTFPIGVPSLMISQGSMRNPVGNLSVMEINSTNSAMLVILIVSIIGIILGSIYFALIASASSDKSERVPFSHLLKQIIQSALLSILLFLTILVIGLPLMCLLSSILFILPSLGVLPFTIVGMLLVWVLMPLFFSPHGIFTNQLKATRSIIVSVRLVRNLMSATGLFLILVILISYGMDLLWSTPAADSWMMLVGIIGHAFISSGLLAATFIYYRDGLGWMNERIVKSKTDFEKITPTK